MAAVDHAARTLTRAGEFLLDLAAHRCVDAMPANVLRRHRVWLGMTHAEIDDVDLQHWRATGRDGEVRW